MQPIVLKENSTRPKVTYLRLSLTDRCNLRCIYCMPSEGISFIPHEAILSYEEILRLVRLSIDAGIRKVRVTGGEPLVRKGILDFLRRLRGLDGLEEITLTTNGVLLKAIAADIKAIGIHRINISLDSLKPERFMEITGRDLFDQVWEGIEEAERVGLSPIKLNVVAMRGINDEEILDFGRLSIARPYHIRFIEYMPVGRENGWRHDRFIASEEIRERLRHLGAFEAIAPGPLDGPAERFRIAGGKGEVGFIGALSNHFCERCNRLRLTPEGHLRGCLFSDEEDDIKGPMRAGASDGELLHRIRLAIQKKNTAPRSPKRGIRKCARNMSTIGG